MCVIDFPLLFHFLFTDVCEPYLGYDVELMDRILISEAVLKLGKGLVSLRDQLESIQSQLPPYEDLESYIIQNQPFNQGLIATASTGGLSFYQETVNPFLPTFAEFNEILSENQAGFPPSSF